MINSVGMQSTLLSYMRVFSVIICKSETWLTPDFKPMRYFFCETDTSAKAVSRAAFLRLLEQQPCPMAQVNIDLEGGYVYLFP